MKETFPDFYKIKYIISIQFHSETEFYAPVKMKI